VSVALRSTLLPSSRKKTLFNGSIGIACTLDSKASLRKSQFERISSLQKNGTECWSAMAQCLPIGLTCLFVFLILEFLNTCISPIIPPLHPINTSW
jgi:hypothetical protein